MKNYILAENLKHKRSFLKKLLVIAPIVAIAHAFIIMPFYFTVNAYNWWYVLLMPATFTLMPALMHRKEERKLKYRALFPLDVNLKKIWLSKIMTALVYIGISATIHLLGVFVLQSFVGNQFTENYVFVTLFFASALLVLTTIWQVPLCFFLAKKVGFFAAIALNAVFGPMLGMLLSDSSFWLYCPYSWAIRAMVPIMHILPNGTVVAPTDPLISNTSLIFPCVLSLCLFLFLAVITAHWFAKIEVR